jgi:hypothetical protein
MGYEIYGPLVATVDVEAAVTATIETWIDSYLAAVEEAHGTTVGFLARPNSYAASFDYDNWSEGQLPAVVVVCDGTSGQIERMGAGDILAQFTVNVDVIVTDTQESLARNVAALYQTAIAAILEQKGSLRGAGTTPFATGTNLTGWRIVLPDVNNRTLVAGTTTVNVLVAPVLNALSGPSVVPAPAESAPPDEPEITSVNTTVTAQPIG